MTTEFAQGSNATDDRRSPKSIATATVASNPSLVVLVIALVTFSGMAMVAWHRGEEALEAIGVGGFISTLIMYKYKKYGLVHVVWYIATWIVSAATYWAYRHPAKALSLIAEAKSHFADLV